MMPKHMVEFVEADLQKVEAAITRHLESEVSFISEVARYVLSSGGKRIRPVLLMLSARLCNYIGERMYDLSAVIEFIHTATLLHDDVIDNASLRRGNPTVHALWGNEMAILIGDYLYSKAMSLALADKDHLVMQTVSDVTVEMAKGQVIETLKLRDLGISEADYYRIIALKTASLFAASCTIGAVLGGLDPLQRGRVQAFGQHLGIAFQMADDTLDFVAPESTLGKPVHNDLKEGKITLPIIVAMQRASASETQVIADYLHKEKTTDADLQPVLALLHKYETLEFTMARAQDHVTQAQQCLDGFSPSPALDILHALADYVVTRDV
ncbi:MAG: polyprenyl synthetase family protein [Candidatus Tectomicrobia bacterium]|uniref:Polyprenyl synthetase family protein n=1 Tax=Tectimicrobiota bacterium TaxID=2528274 RepID=A0A938B6C6_UNCTE|nr:polyprenyl synthetase family protein [Candidatus Tectomicrobia bacterium]